MSPPPLLLLLLQAYTSTVALGDFGMTPTAVNPGRSYRYYNGSSGPLLVRFGQVRAVAG